MSDQIVEMDRQGWFKKFSGKGKATKIFGALGVVLFFGLALTTPVRKQLQFIFQSGAKAAHAPKAPSLFDTYKEAWVSMNQKVTEIRRADEENERLRMENAHLRVKLEGMQYECKTKDVASFTSDLGKKLKTATGSPVGRILATLGYKPPTHLTQGQLFTLGVSYFKAREDEKAAVIFTMLSDLEGLNPYREPRTYLLTAASWYRLDNFEMANKYLDKALEVQETPEILPFQAQARLWKALTASRLNKQADAQQWLKDLVDHHPHSTEAGWVNSKEAIRATASHH